MTGSNRGMYESGYVDNWQSGKSLEECNLHMLMTGDSCDVSFRVGKEATLTRAHSFVLISRSCVFHAMLRDPLAERENVPVPEIEYKIFFCLLRYLYTDELSLTPSNVSDLLYAAKKYAVRTLEELCLSFLQHSLSVENACVVMEQAHFFDEKYLYNKSLGVIFNNGGDCLATPDFQNLCRACMDAVISSDRLSASPKQIFTAVLSWAKAECGRRGRATTPLNVREQLGHSLFTIPFTAMDKDFYVKQVLPLGILTADENVKIMACLLCQGQDPTPFRKDVSSVTFDVMFYSGSCVIPLSNANRRRSRVDFTSQSDVQLLGVYLFGLPGESTYHIRILKPESGVRGHLLDEVYDTSVATGFEGGKVRAVKLKRPVKVEKNSWHLVYVKVNGKPSNYHGDGVIRNVDIGPCSITKLPYEHTYSDYGNIIYGLCVQAERQ